MRPDQSHVIKGALPVIAAGKSGCREESENYPAVVVKLNAGWRVIECRDGIQWILQRLAGKRHGQARWEGRSYCRTRQALLRLIHRCCGPVGIAELAVVEALPNWVDGSGVKNRPCLLGGNSDPAVERGTARSDLIAAVPSNNDAEEHAA
ncbi:hypothetical protein [Mesorhizobium sp. BR-1-1-10]|uniref:hypothetical protein n=1 Tax=Mesorhizobium sp. BR-1-1-10 TaxID=2876660 RepID=UPI001CD1235B|nr:hypothetical protein [Mesorhizobium sp. BR-1-1-10]MBZ9975965.1 hypothetical protein [Mesorhizobium sp. BR-1-1-10]